MARQVIVSTLMSLATASVLLASTAAVAADSGSGSSSASAVGPVVASSSSSDAAATTTTTAAAAASSSSDAAATTTTTAAAAASSSSDAATTTTSTTTTTTKPPTTVASTTTKTTTKSPTSTGTTTTTKATLVTKTSTTTATTTQATTLRTAAPTLTRPTTQFANETLPPTAAPTRRPTTARTTKPTTTGENGETDTTLATTTTEAFLAPTIVEMVMVSPLSAKELYAALYFELMGNYPDTYPEYLEEVRRFSKMDTDAKPTIDVSCEAVVGGFECIVTITIPTVPEETLAPGQTADPSTTKATKAPGAIDLGAIRNKAVDLVENVRKSVEDPANFSFELKPSAGAGPVTVAVVGLPYIETPPPMPDTTTPEPFVGGTVARVATTAVACLLAAVVGLCAF